MTLDLNSIINVRHTPDYSHFPVIIFLLSQTPPQNNIYLAWLVGGCTGGIILDGRGFVHPPSLVIVIGLEM